LIKAWPCGFKVVRDAVDDAELGPWLERMLMDEVVPVLEGRVDDPTGFTREVLDRFRNPFIDHEVYRHCLASRDEVGRPPGTDTRRIPSEIRERTGATQRSAGDAPLVIA
jgi:mannitol-1-phosphate/altronate dehydrogenase